MPTLIAKGDRTPMFNGANLAYPVTASTESAVPSQETQMLRPETPHANRRIEAEILGTLLFGQVLMALLWTF
jgi:hypothetical protein